MKKETFCCEALGYLCEMADELRDDLERNEERLEFFENQPSFQPHNSLYQRFAQVHFLLLRNRLDICLKVGEHRCNSVALSDGANKPRAMQSLSDSTSSSLKDTRKRKREKDGKIECQEEIVSGVCGGRMVLNVHRSSPYVYQEVIIDPSLFTQTPPSIQTEAYQKAKKTLATIIKRIHDNDMVVIGSKGERINVTRHRELMQTYKDSLADGSLNVSELFQGTWTAYNIMVSSKKKSLNVAHVFIPLYAIA
ncbi:hypothetical protein EON63_15025 [archaeon]|nr:MAG: hypothetical protein EON63_15025 [archaeon]